MSPLMQRVEALASRVRLLESDVEAVERGEGDGADRPYLLPATEERDVARTDTDFRAGESRDTVSENLTPEERVERGISLEWSCESITGTATLSGISGYSADAAPYDPMYPESWEGQYRKWKKRTLGGTFSYTDRLLTCEGECYDGLRLDYSGDYVPGVSSASLDDYRGCPPTFSATFGVTEINDLPRSFQNGCVDASSVSRQAATFTLTTATAFICIGYECAYWNSPPAGDVYRQRSTTATEELLEEQQPFEAVLAQDPDAEEGTSCCGKFEAADMTSPESIDPISVTGEFVRVPVLVKGGDPLIDYLVNVTLAQRVWNVETSEFDTVFTEVPVIVKGSTDTNYYPPPGAPEEEPICVINAELMGLAA